MKTKQELLRPVVFLEIADTAVFLSEAASFPEAPEREDAGTTHAFQKFLGETSAGNHFRSREEAWRQLKSASSAVKAASRDVRSAQPDNLAAEAAKKAGMLKVIPRATQKKADERKKQEAAESAANWKAWKEEEEE